MHNYVPFLKLKVNEIGSLKVLDTDIKGIVPFFDIPKQKDGATPDKFESLVSKAAKSVKSNLTEIKTFFLDNFDIDDTIVISGKHNYAFVIECFRDLDFVPVVGLDRPAARNQLVFDYKKSGAIKSNYIALRLLADDFLNFKLVKAEIADLIKKGNGLFKNWVLVLDNRVCINIDISERAEQLTKFVHEISKEFEFYSIIITGSSIPASIRDLLNVESETTYPRRELKIYEEAAKNLTGYPIFIGDYTIVSPLYAEFTIPPEAMRNVIAPKIFYSYKSYHYVARGGALRTHARGDLQYNDMAADIITKPFYRGAKYSFGDNYLYEKANHIGKAVTPSSILKPTINAHITYMVRDFSI